jgi:hypothetical protein
MDRNRRPGNRRLVALGACVAAMLAASCTTEVQPVGDPRVLVRQDHGELLGTSKVYRNGEEVAVLRTLRVSGPAGRRVIHEVRDLHLNTLGYIDEQACAWRYSAHEGSTCVANSSDRRRNVAAILGAYGADVELVEEGPATPSTPMPSSRK